MMRRYAAMPPTVGGTPCHDSPASGSIPARFAVQGPRLWRIGPGRPSFGNEGIHAFVSKEEIEMTVRTFPLVAAMAVAALPVLAQDASSVPDANGDGSWSMEEITAAVPDLTPETYATIDANADGAVSYDELSAAIAGGVITPAG